MHRIGNRLGALLFAASLAFGVTSSFAQAGRVPPTAGACPDDGWSISAGACTSPEMCDLKCKGRWFEGGDCISGIEGNCCVCRA
jgi:hypothetical protein